MTYILTSARRTQVFSCISAAMQAAQSDAYRGAGIYEIRDGDGNVVAAQW